MPPDESLEARDATKDVADDARASWWREELRAVAHICPPIMTQFGSQQLLMATQLVYCGNESREALTTMTIAATMWNMLWMAITGAGGTMDTLGSQAHGAGDARAVKSWALLTTCAITAFCVPANAILAAGKEIAIGVFKADKSRAGEIRDCALIMCGSFYPLAATLGLQKYLSVRRKVGAVGLTSVATLFVNIAFHHALVKQHKMGVIGSSIAMVAARAMNLAMLLAYVCVDERWWAKGALDEWRSAKTAITRDMVARVAHLSTQGVIMVFGEAFSFEVTVVLAAQLGEVSLGAHMVMLNICTMTFMMGPMSFGTAASIRVGNLLGMRDPRGAKRSAWLITSMSLTFMAGCSFMILFAIKPIARLYTGNDPEITATLIKIAPYAAAFQIFDASLGCCNGILRACGKQAFIAKSNLASLWLCGLTSGALITFVGDEGVKGLWVGLMIGVGMAGSFLASVVYRLDWQHESFLATRAATNVFRGGAAL